MLITSTLWFQLEDTVLLIGTLLLFDPVLFPKYEAWLLIGSILNFEALLGAPLIKTTQHLLHIPLKVCLLIGSWPYILRHVMRLLKCVGYFFPSLANVNTECRELLLCNHALCVWQERESCAVCFSPQLGACVAAAAFSLFRITLPVFRICYKVCLYPSFSLLPPCPEWRLIMSIRDKP